MPAKSKKQFKLIQAKRSQYETKAATPAEWKWVWDKEWIDGVDYDKLPEGNIMKFEEKIQELLESESKIDGVTYDTIKYEAVHGKKPKFAATATGYFMFHIGYLRSGESYKDDQAFQYRGKYKDALKAAATETKMRGKDTFYLLP
ncbi:MAG TPA: hypothetical protein PLA71_00835 [Saccharofermentans sp.]|nr:hypothetical protein [Saccharofermentans sp.]